MADPENNGDTNRMTLDVIENEVCSIKESIEKLNISNNDQHRAVNGFMMLINAFYDNFNEKRGLFWVHRE